MSTSRLLTLAVAAAAVLQLLYFYPRMPGVMASHFDGAGNPNGFQSRDGFFGMTVVMLAFLLLLFAGGGVLLRRIPARYFNLPNREYWMSEGRETATREFLTERMERFGAATLILLVLVLQLVFEANLSGDPRLNSSSMWWLLGLYLLYTTLWLVRFLRRFRLPEDAAQSQPSP